MTDGGERGSLRWAQWQSDPFTAEEVVDGGFLLVDSLQQNLVRARIPVSTSSVEARAVFSGAIGATERGRLAGQFRVVGTLGSSVGGNPVWVELLTPSQRWAVAARFHSGVGRLISEQGTVSTEELAHSIGQSAFLAEWNTLEVSWQRNAFRKIWLNGSLLEARTLTPPTDGLPPSQDITRLRLGAATQAGNTEPFEVELRDWQVHDDPDATPVWNP